MKLEEFQNQRSKIWTWASGAIASLTALVTIVLAVSSTFVRDRAEVELRDAKARAELAQLQAARAMEAQQLARTRAELEARLAEASRQLAEVSSLAVTRTPSQASSELARKIADLQIATDKAATESRKFGEQVSLVEKRLKDIEGVILSDPTKALALPLLQRDVQSIGQQLDRGLASLKSENDRVYDLMKWVLGLMGLVSLSLIGTAVGNVFKKEPVKEQPKEPAKEPAASTPPLLPKNSNVETPAG